MFRWHGDIKRKRKAILYRKIPYDCFLLELAYFSESAFYGKIESSLKFGAARGENVGMQLETERLFVPKACSCTYL